MSTFVTDSGKKLLTIIEGPVHEQIHRLFEGVKSTDLKMLADFPCRFSMRCELALLPRKQTRLQTAASGHLSEMPTNGSTFSSDQKPLANVTIDVDESRENDLSFQTSPIVEISAKRRKVQFY